MSPDNSPVLEKTALNFEDLRDEGLDYATESYLAKFFIKDEDNLTIVISNYTKAGHERRKLENREYIEIEINFLMTPPLILSHSIQFWLSDQLPLRSSLHLSNTGLAHLGMIYLACLCDLIPSSGWLNAL